MSHFLSSKIKSVFNSRDLSYSVYFLIACIRISSSPFASIEVCRETFSVLVRRKLRDDYGEVKKPDDGPPGVLTNLSFIGSRLVQLPDLDGDETNTRFSRVLLDK